MPLPQGGERLAKAGRFTNDSRYLDVAHRSVAAMQPIMARYPQGLGQRFQALAYAHSRPHMRLPLSAILTLLTRRPC
jgi:hypothetical protein